MTRNDHRISTAAVSAAVSTAVRFDTDHRSQTLAETSFRRSLPEMPPTPASPVLAIGAILSLLLIASVPAGAGLKPLLQLSLPVEAETRAGAGAEAHSFLSICVLIEAAQVSPTCAAQPIASPDLSVSGSMTE